MAQANVRPEGAAPHGITRRSMLTASAAAAPLLMVPRRTEAQVLVLPPSPPTTPWVEELPLHDTPLAPSPLALNPAPTLLANVAGGECGRVAHQRYNELTGPGGVAAAPVQYQLTAKENPSWRFNGDNA